VRNGLEGGGRIVENRSLERNTEKGKGEVLKKGGLGGGELSESTKNKIKKSERSHPEGSTKTQRKNRGIGKKRIKMTSRVTKRRGKK